MLAIVILGVIAIIAAKFWDAKLKPMAQQYNLPRWFVMLNLFALTPILVYPLAAYASIFLFDNSNALETWLIFTLIVSYPLFLLVIMYISYILYTKAKPLAVLLPVAEMTLFTILFIKYIVL